MLPLEQAFLSIMLNQALACKVPFPRVSLSGRAEFCRRSASIQISTLIWKIYLKEHITDLNAFANSFLLCVVVQSECVK